MQGADFLFSHNFFIQPPQSQYADIQVITNMWVFLHSLLANHCSSECQECRDQSINKCLLNVCCLGDDVVLLSAKNTVSERGIKSIVLPQALKFNLPTLCSYQHLREGSQMSWEQPVGEVTTISFSFYCGFNRIPEAPSTHQMDQTSTGLPVLHMSVGNPPMFCWYLGKCLIAFPFSHLQSSQY